MSSVDHDRSLLGAYALGGLDPREAQLVHDHLLTCADCRREVADLAELRVAMDDVPPEAFLDGPPDGSDLILQRTLRAARAEAPAVVLARPRRSLALVAASVIIAAAVALGGGILIGRQTAPDSTAQAMPANAPAATDSQTGATLTVALTRQTGWVRVHAVAKGIPAGEPCQLLVVRKDGQTVLAGSWLVSEKGARDGTTLDGSALIDPGQVQSVDVVTTSGMRYVSVPV
jgi:anti-sigma factor RsiW